MARTIIIGAGLTGLSAAYHLEKKGCTDLLIVEKESTIGGLCRSVTSNDFTFDYTGHFLHLQNPAVAHCISHTVGFNFFDEITRHSYIYSHECYTPYPYQMHLHGLPIDVCVDCIEGFVARDTNKNPQSFHAWVLAHFGKGFGKHFFFPYQQKICDYDVRKLQASWTGRFVPSTTLRTIIEGTLSANAHDAVGYNATFFYPKTPGIETFIKAFARNIRTPITTACTVTRINLAKKIVVLSDGTTHPYEHIISTMPLDSLLTILDDAPTTAFNHAQGKLQCTSVINLNLGLKTALPTDKQWVYYPESTTAWYRLGYPQAICPASAPTGGSSLSIEISHRKRTRAWQHEALARAKKEVSTVLHIDPAMIATEVVLSLPHAYVVYDAWREKNLTCLLNRLAQQDIYSIGRYGAWKYASMHEAILDGKNIADSLTITPAHRAEDAVTITPKQNKNIYQRL